MMSSDFSTTTYGKWILAGEHAVLRGHGALVFPVPQKQLTLHYQHTMHTRELTCHGTHGQDMQRLFWKVLEQGFQLLNSPLPPVQGRFQLYNDIPVGVGLGASAALCVAIARWFAAQHQLDTAQIASFAQELEHLFHGKSSGLDIAGVASTVGLYFQQGLTNPLLSLWKPMWYLSSCGQVGKTSLCIRQVQRVWETNAAQAQTIDRQMAHSVALAEHALTSPPSPETKQQLIQAVNNAADCFAQWGLVSDTLQHHLSYLRQAGAVAVKPTGSGAGGHVISVWSAPPPATLLASTLLPLF